LTRCHARAPASRWPGPLREAERPPSRCLASQRRRGAPPPSKR
jgi:hypothetical protein